METNRESRRTKVVKILQQLRNTGSTADAARAINSLYGYIDELFLVALGHAVAVWETTMMPIEAADKIESEYFRKWASPKKKKKKEASDPDADQVFSNERTV